MIIRLTEPLGMILSAMTIAIIFITFPEIDLLSSAALYRNESGFFLKDNQTFIFVHRNIGKLVCLTAISSLFILVLGRTSSRIAPLRQSAVFCLLVLALGPGLVVNVILKDHWGRARPKQTVEFGGKAQFSPAWVISDQCKKNCSFVCGDASIGFALASTSFISRRPRRWLVTGLIVGGALGLMRMAQGGHFLSDVIFSFYVVWFTAWSVNKIISPIRNKL